MTHHIVYTATSHGFGHAAILTAVMAAVSLRYPSIRQTLVTTVPEAVLRARLPVPFALVPYQCPTDFGMLMSGSTRVRLAETLSRYRAEHTAFNQALDGWDRVLGVLRPSLVVSCLSYAAIASATRRRLPAVTLGPFLWHDIVGAYAPGARDVLGTMAECYQKADAFLLTTPFVTPTVSGPKRAIVGPVGLGGHDRSDDLKQRGLLLPGERAVFASLGGIDEQVPYEAWRCPSGWRLLTQSHSRQTGLSVSDLIASASAVVTKPGYGTYVEAALAGAHLISRARPDWPETVGLLRWYREIGLRVAEVTEAAFSEEGPLTDLEGAMDCTSAALSSRSVPYGRITAGAEACADLIVGSYLPQ